MSFFDRKTVNGAIQTTEGFYFGKSESEGEDSYKDSNNTPFDDYLDILPKIAEGYFIITGRKGSGKSAIAKYIKDNATPDNFMFCEIVKSDAINLEKCIQQSPVESEEKMVPFFEWLILVKLVKLILESKCGEYTKELKAIQNFVRNNRGIIEIDKFSVKEMDTITKLEINFRSLLNILSFKTIIDRTMGKRLEKAPYFKLLPALKEIVYKVLGFEVFKDSQFVVIFDDLDIGFRADSDQDKQTLMQLIRSAKEIHNDLRELKNTKILILLRDDIKKVLEGFEADASKIFSSYEVELEWYDDKNENQTRLRKFVNRRIEYNFQRKGLDYLQTNPWETLFFDNEGCYGMDYFGNTRSAFKYILDFTFFRPRDFILFLKNVGAGKYSYPMDRRDISELLQKYANDNVSEIKSELAIHFTQEQINGIFATLKSLTSFQNSGFWKDDILTKLKEHNLDVDAFQKLVDYYLISPFDSKTGKFYLAYRNANPLDYDINSEDIKYKLHKCIYAYFFPK